MIMKPILLILACMPVFSAVAEEGLPPISFNRDIRPILSENCYYCHGTDANHRKGDRRLDTREGALENIGGVRALVPGQPDESDLILRIFSGDEDHVMPPPDSNKVLSDAQKQLLRHWVAEGAEYEPHWAFVPPVRPAVPEGVNAIDHFVGATLAANGLAFSPAEKDGVLLRRVSLDVTGLPPTLEEIEGFEKDPTTYVQAVDRLLNSPGYGERMAMDWLDVARYADTNGYQGDAYRMNWPWRDWVVGAFIGNVPFDQFTIGQVAGDLLENSTRDQLIATAFNRNHMINAEGGTIAEENRTKNVFDRVETTSGAFLGLTMQCCQCHDHKFDPLTQEDYFSMYAFFNQLSEPGSVDRRFGRKAHSDDYDKLYSVESPVIELSDPIKDAVLAAARAAKSAAEKAVEDRQAEYEPAFVAWIMEMRADTDLINQRLVDDGQRRSVTSVPLDNLKDYRTRNLLMVFLKSQAQWKPLMDALAAAQDQEDAALIAIPQVMVMRDDHPRETFILERGNYETPGAKVEPGVPAFLPALSEGVKADRLALAKWLVSPEQPLMPRVVMNRLWQMFFGRGLVKTADDFGLQGSFPSHPELLDWLGVEFRESGWDLKHMVKLIVTSRTYRQSQIVPEGLLEKDPENILLARGPRFRLDARFIRDQALALSGLLVEKRGGFPVMPYQPPGIWEDVSFGKNRYFQGSGEDLHRRSLYTFWRRSVGPSNFFDAPSRQVCALMPSRTNTPLQALTTLNDITYVEAARVWAEKLADHPNDRAKLRHLMRSATARDPEEREMTTLLAALEEARSHYTTRPAEASELIATGDSPISGGMPPAEHAAWTSVCLLVLNLDETLTK